ISLLEIGGYKISYADYKDSLNSIFSKSEQQKFQDLLHEAQIHPKKAYPRALEWQSKVENSKELDNLVAYLHLQNKQIEKAESLTYASFLKYPDYFFAKINYADQCLRKNKTDEIPFIFPSFDLKELFPTKKIFHVSEFRGFMLVACNYHLKIKKYDLAKSYYENARLADPLHPSVLFLEKKFSRNRIIQFFQKIYKNAKEKK
ncbi:MAG: hypothetical protein JSS09_06410, partial [Verrucomicrobia bacterium]|nr:hypothetical protein [Verrucomicrobiota bacterium]